MKYYLNQGCFTFGDEKNTDFIVVVTMLLVKIKYLIKRLLDSYINYIFNITVKMNGGRNEISNRK